MAVDEFVTDKLSTATTPRIQNIRIPVIEKTVQPNKTWSGIYAFFLYVVLLFAVQPFLNILLKNDNSAAAKLFVYSRAAVMLMSAAILLLRPAERPYRPSLLIIFALLFPVYMFISISWTVNVLDSTQSAFFTTCYIFLGYLFARKFGAGPAINVVARVGLILIVMSIITAVILPNIGRMTANDAVEGGHAGAWRGVFIHKNQLGAFSALCFVIYSVFPRSISNIRVVQLFAIFSTFVCLYFSKSANGLASGVIVVALYYLTRLPGMRSLFGLISVSVLAPIVIWLADSVTNGDSDVVFSLLGRNSNFTGRTVIWRLAMDQARAAPWWGQGYGAVGLEVLRDKMITEIGKNAVDVHSGYLYILTEAGGVGAVLFLAMSVAAIICGLSAWGRTKDALRKMQLEVLMAIVVMFYFLAVAEITFPPERTGAIFFLVIGLLYAANSERNVEHGPALPVETPTEIASGRPQRKWSALAIRRGPARPNPRRFG
jgi:O-antigen ligase